MRCRRCNADALWSQRFIRRPPARCPQFAPASNTGSIDYADDRVSGAPHPELQRDGIRDLRRGSSTTIKLQHAAFLFIRPAGTSNCHPSTIRPADEKTGFGSARIGTVDVGVVL